MMKRLLLSCIGFYAMFMANALTPDSAQMAIDTFVLHPDMQHASMTIAVADIKTGKIIASHNPDEAVGDLVRRITTRYIDNTLELILEK